MFAPQALHEEILGHATLLDAAAASAGPILQNNPLETAVSGQLSQARSRYQALVNSTEVGEKNKQGESDRS